MVGRRRAGRRHPAAVRRVFERRGREDPSGSERPGGAGRPIRSPRRHRAPKRRRWPSAEPAAAEPKAQAGPVLLVEDDAEPVHGQMRRAEFMEALRSSVLRRRGRCFRRQRPRLAGVSLHRLLVWLLPGSQRVTDRTVAPALRAGKAAKAASARDYIRVVTARLRRSAGIYARTGQLVGLPEDMPGAGGGGLLGAFGGMFFKARPRGARQADPVSVRDQLGSGEPLPGDDAFADGNGVRHRLRRRPPAH